MKLIDVLLLLLVVAGLLILIVIGLSPLHFLTDPFQGVLQ